MSGSLANIDLAFLRKSKRDNIDDDLPSVHGADLFCGCGGLSLGAREACISVGYRFKIVLAIDKDSSSLDTYKANFTPEKTFEQDIKDIVDGAGGSTITYHEKLLLEKLAPIDILLAGPPCQGHSDLNNHTRRSDERNELYERVGRFAEIVLVCKQVARRDACGLRPGRFWSTLAVFSRTDVCSGCAALGQPAGCMG